MGRNKIQNLQKDSKSSKVPSGSSFGSVIV